MPSRKDVILLLNTKGYRFRAKEQFWGKIHLCRMKIFFLRNRYPASCLPLLCILTFHFALKARAINMQVPYRNGSFLTIGPKFLKTLWKRDLFIFSMLDFKMERFHGLAGLCGR